MPDYDPPPPLDAATLRADVAGPGRHWRQLDVVEQTGSTNADLLTRAAAGEDIAGGCGPPREHS
jgi:BirA family biotin operon repressor/biotin-[acetyl-CoA-carboxylase] ligase